MLFALCYVRYATLIQTCRDLEGLNVGSWQTDVNFLFIVVSIQEKSNFPAMCVAKAVFIEAIYNNT